MNESNGVKRKRSFVGDRRIINVNASPKLDECTEEIPDKKRRRENPSQSDVDDKVTDCSLDALNGNLSELISRIQPSVSSDDEVDDMDIASNHDLTTIEPHENVSSNEIESSVDSSRISRNKEIECRIAAKKRKILRTEVMKSKNVSYSSKNSLQEKGNSPNAEGISYSKLTPTYVDMTETVGKLELETGSVYSYKKILEENDDIERPQSENKYLVVRENMSSDTMADIDDPLPERVEELLDNVKKQFNEFFAKMEKAKGELADPSIETQPSSQQMLKNIDNLVDSMKKFPALMELELAIFTKKCHDLYSTICNEIVEENKKHRWCAFCLNHAFFHCCFKASYCSVKCQRKDWSQHSEHCRQQFHSLLDPHLRLNNVMAAKVAALNKEDINVSQSENLSKRLTAKNKAAAVNTIANCRRQENSISASENKQKRDFTFMKNKNLKNLIQQTSVQNSTKPIPQSERGVFRKNKTFEGGNFEFVELKPRASPVCPEELIAQRDIDLDANVTLQETNVSSSSVEDVLSTKLTETTVEDHPIGSNQQVILQLPDYQAASTSSCAPPVTLLKVQPPPDLKSFSAAKSPKETIDTSSRPIAIKFKSVTLPSGEQKLIPVDSGTNLLTNPHLKGNSTKHNSILIRPATTSTNVFFPISQLVNTFSTQPTNTVTIKRPPPMRQPQMPALTPIAPKRSTATVRTLNDEELNKILNADHLLNAFDSSYYANVRIRP